MHLFVLLAASLAGVAVAIVLAAYGLVTVGKSKGSSRKGRLLAAALLAGAGAVSVYVWGMLHLLGAVFEAEDDGTDSSPLRPCREAGLEAAYPIDGYDVDYVPLRFNCQIDGRTAYTISTVPGYVNPATSVLGLLAAILGVLAAATAETRRPPDAGLHGPVT